MSSMYKQAEWHLYHYLEIKEKENKTLASIQDDAYNSAFGTGDGTPVKSSYTGSKTERAAERMTALRGKVLTPIEKMWLWAIEDVWAMYTREDPAMARVMERAFGLSKECKKVHRGNKGVIRDEIMADFYIERPQTFFKYRKDIVNAVIEAALVFKVYNKKYVSQK